MNSRLYRCKVMHKRQKPKQHRFAYECFVFCIDLDEIETLSKKLNLLSANKRNFYSLRDSDHLREGKASIKDNVVSYLRSQGIEDPIGKIELVTNLRTWGYVFNPVSFYFIHRPDNSLLCCLAEVANTFNEQKLYIVSQFDPNGEKLSQSHPKQFYISPFSEPDTKLNFRLSQPGKRINLVITESDNEGEYFYSALSGERRDLTNRELSLLTLRFPFLTLKVIAAIHWQALKLYLKRIPFYPKNHRPDQQKNTRIYLERHKNKRTPLNAP
ncbi:conserved hypothetical protein [Verrucomicrobiia bacterium DG1235]|nr:conserved hypothetical protein [Verrucomicrobiae bacterium DG1235]